MRGRRPRCTMQVALISKQSSRSRNHSIFLRRKSAEQLLRNRDASCCFFGLSAAWHIDQWRQADFPESRILRGWVSPRWARPRLVGCRLALAAPSICNASPVTCADSCTFSALPTYHSIVSVAPLICSSKQLIASSGCHNPVEDSSTTRSEDDLHSFNMCLTEKWRLKISAKHFSSFIIAIVRGIAGVLPLPRGTFPTQPKAEQAPALLRCLDALRP